jgi:[ribosomal protein S5]-alanine N-acetyltransferase
MDHPLVRLRQTDTRLSALELSIRTPRQRDCQALADLLCRDTTLRQSLGVGETNRPSAEDFHARIRRWCEENDALSLAIVNTDGQAIGLISLSHINAEEHSAGIGYWLASDCWGQGYISQAFALGLWLARSAGILRVHARVDQDNTASLRVWQRYEAEQRPGGGRKVECTIDLHSVAPAYARLLTVLREIGFPLEGDAPAEA